MSDIRAPGTVTTVTILCTEVVASADIRGRLGEVRADRLLAGHQQLLRTMTYERGSTFVRSRGDGIMAVFPSATAGLEAIIAIERALARENRVAAERTAIRAALSAGDVRWGEDDIAGLPPVEAARLLVAAHGDQVLCTDLVCLLSQGRSQCEFREYGMVPGKGLAEPMHAYELMWRGADPR
ncbi:MAG TPA: adenylate/guanylate cyclase domain-containing protein [Streptosporangiaceae bacterium]|nr:adenylate/guanylate cyclase domain-containing protein [Streptosporangiaceae bacterium]